MKTKKRKKKRNRNKKNNRNKGLWVLITNKTGNYVTNIIGLTENEIISKVKIMQDRKKRILILVTETSTYKALKYEMSQIKLQNIWR